MGSITEDSVISVGSGEPYALGISAISIVFKISESRK
jgi:ATP-dependent protease HslVU (ClpYQ) peptidase subunit